MEKPIQVSYRWSANEMLLLNKIHMRSSSLGRKLRIGGIIVICLGFLSLCAIGMTPDKPRALATGLPLVLLGLLVLVGMPLLMRRTVLKMYAKKPDRDLVITYELGEERLSCKSDVASSDLLWRAIQRVLRTADGYLIYITDTQIHWLPVHGFQDAADLERFAQLAKAKVGEYKDVR